MFLATVYFWFWNEDAQFGKRAKNLLLLDQNFLSRCVEQSLMILHCCTLKVFFLGIFFVSPVSILVI